MQALIDETRELPDGGRQHVLAEETTYAPVCRTGGTAHSRLGGRGPSCKERHGSEAAMAAKKRRTAVVGHGRVIGAEEQLALARCHEPFADIQVDPIGAATRLAVQVCKTESGDVVQDAHPSAIRVSVPERPSVVHQHLGAGSNR